MKKKINLIITILSCLIYVLVMFIFDINLGTLKYEDAENIVKLWGSQNIKNIRFSGGEPTLYPRLLDLVKLTKSFPSVEHIAISTNGYSSLEYYKELIDAGVNDFSISLDACCSAFGNKMSGGIEGAWEKVVENIKELSKLTYVTVGVVVTEETIDQLVDVVKFADSLGISDIRIISAAQFNRLLENVKNLPDTLVNKYPILKYRVNNIKNNVNVRGMDEFSAKHCALSLDDMAVAKNKHFPCIIYMREGGAEIGQVGPDMRKEREEWFKNHNSYNDPICKQNCLDVCTNYNNLYMNLKIDGCKLEKLDSSLFTFDLWEAGSVHDFLGETDCRYDNLIQEKYKNAIKENAVGWCRGEDLSVRAKEKHVAIMCFYNGKHFWFHLRNNEFYEIFCGE